MFKNLVAFLGVATMIVATVVLGAAVPERNKGVERGQYLVERVAMCVDCHSPRTERGELDRTRWLRGSKLGFGPRQPVPVWADYAPELAGLPGWTDDAMIKLLTTGQTPAGDPPRPPMPAYRMSRNDAAAVAAYLRSLKPKSR